MDWLYLINTFWPIVAVAVTLIAGAFTMWLMTKVPSKAAHDGLHEKFTAHELTLANHAERLKHVEAHIDSAPTRQELQDDIAELSSRMSAMEEGQHGIARQLQTMNSYLHTLIEKAIPGAIPK
jgi:chromosome segregation ATPase